MHSYCIRRDNWCYWCPPCKYVTWSAGCLGVGEAARGEQLLANQDKSGWVFAPRAKEAGSLSKWKEGWFTKWGQDEAKTEARGGLTRKSSLLHVYICSYFSHICYLQIMMPCVKVINKPCVRRTVYMRLISWIHRRGSEHICIVHWNELCNNALMFSIITLNSLRKIMQVHCALRWIVPCTLKWCRNFPFISTGHEKINELHINYSLCPWIPLTKARVFPQMYCMLTRDCWTTLNCMCTCMCLRHRASCIFSCTYLGLFRIVEAE
jgi:hypothetical protein